MSAAPAAVDIALARSRDVAAVVDMMRDLYEQDRVAFDPVMQARALDVFVRDHAAGRAWVIRDGGSLIGYAFVVFGYSMEYGGRDAFLDELFVKAPHRGRGVGRAMMRVIDEACRAHEIKALHLEVERDNVNAQEFYRRVGFVDHDRYLLTKLY